MSSGASVLTVKNLKKHFRITKDRLVRAVDGIDLEISRGMTFGLVGESGCGKSTALRTIARLTEPTGGEISFRGQDITSLEQKNLFETRQHMQIVFQDPYDSLSPRLCIWEIISEPLIIHRKKLKLSMAEIKQKTYAVMEKVGVSPRFSQRYPHEFSGGQRQRISIARALIMEPELVLLDEAVSALDVSIQAQILNLLSELQREMNPGYLFISHDLAVVRHISDMVGVMYLGVIVEKGPCEIMYQQPLHPYTESLLSAAPIPDPEIEKKRERIILAGEIPSPEDNIQGCRFYSRCPKKMDRCAVSEPELKEVKPGRFCACFLY